MEFCIGSCAKIDQVGWARQAEDLGASHFGVGEGPLLFSDQLMREAGCDMVSVFLSNPFTAERDIADIGSSILSRA